MATYYLQRIPTPVWVSRKSLFSKSARGVWYKLRRKKMRNLRNRSKGFRNKESKLRQFVTHRMRSALAKTETGAGERSVQWKVSNRLLPMVSHRRKIYGT